MRRLITAATLVLILLFASNASAIFYNKVTVATAATLIRTAPLAGVIEVRVRCAAAGQTVFLGDVNVTTANGYELITGNEVSVRLAYGESLYGIVAATTQPITYIAWNSAQ